MLFLPDGQGTKVIVVYSYDIKFPQPIHADADTFKRMAREGWQQDLQKLKSLMEK